MRFSIRPGLFIALFCTFILFTVIGTLSHETGHFVVAEYYGYSARIHYGSTSWLDEKTMDSLQEVTFRYHQQIVAQEDFPGKEEYFAFTHKILHESFWIGVGGPIQTMLTGTIGLLLLIFSAGKIRQAGTLTSKHWLYIFLALFWLRQTANLAVGIGFYLLKGRFPHNSDEISLAHDLGLPFWSIESFTAAIGLGVLWYVLFNIIPTNIRVTFLCAGLSGGIAGYVLWLEILGPVIMP